MFGFGRSGKIKAAARKFIEAISMATETNHKEFSEIILEGFLDDEVAPERAAEIFGFYPSDILTFVALISSELARLVHHFDDEVAKEIAKASLYAIDKVTTQSYREAVLQPIFFVMENVEMHHHMGAEMPESEYVKLVAWNVIKIYGYEEIDEVRALMDNEKCKNKLRDFLTVKGGNWWKTARDLGISPAA